MRGASDIPVARPYGAQRRRVRRCPRAVCCTEMEDPFGGFGGHCYWRSAPRLYRWLRWAMTPVLGLSVGTAEHLRKVDPHDQDRYGAHAARDHWGDPGSGGGPRVSQSTAEDYDQRSHSQHTENDERAALVANQRVARTAALAENVDQPPGPQDSDDQRSYSHEREEPPQNHAPTAVDYELSVSASTSDSA